MAILALGTSMLLGACGGDGTLDELVESLESSSTLPATAEAAEPADEPEGGDEGSTTSSTSTTTTTTTQPEIELGTREDPFAYGVPAALTLDTFGDADGSVWNTTIGEPADVTAVVLAENQFNSPPPDGVVFVGFSVEMMLVEAGKEPLSPGFNFTWELLGGATAAVYGQGTIETEGFGCGVTPGAFDDFAEVFVGGTLSGLVCIPLPVEDFGHPATQVSINHSGGDRTIFG